MGSEDWYVAKGDGIWKFNHQTGKWEAVNFLGLTPSEMAAQRDYTDEDVARAVEHLKQLGQRLDGAAE